MSEPSIRGSVPGARLFYAAAVAGMVVSLNTSWSYFGEVIGITDLVERGVMFFPLELAQLACGWGMRASIREHGKPGPARFIAWFLCAVSAYMAWGLSGLLVAVVRVLLGPVLSLVMLHLALGMEIRSLKVKDDSLLARVGRELRERFLATLGLGDEERSAQVIRRDRARRKAVRVKMTGRGSKRDKRIFVENLATAEIANDPEAQKLFINGMKLAANVDAVWEQKYPLPFDVSGATGETPLALSPGATGATEVDTSGDSDSATDTERVTPPPVALAPRSGSANLQVEAILKLIEDDGADAVTIDVVKARFGMTHSTAARRLRAAKERLAS